MSLTSILTRARGVQGILRRTNTHFLRSASQNPLLAKLKENSKEAYDKTLGDHTGRQQNAIYSEEDIIEARRTMYKHKPSSVMDHVMNKIMYTMYHTFNFITGYKHDNPSTSAIEWRLIILESVAGVPGFVAASSRHFKSLRTLQRDGGWIMTLLEEAENERMHLLVCLAQFEASFVTRSLVLLAQSILGPGLTLLYMVHPKSMHRFVGYLEETAVFTYDNVITHVETPGTHLHKDWANLAAPPMAIGYWKLPHDAKWVDCLKCMLADEAHHRDVNHTFAVLKGDDPNPFLLTHKENAMKAWRLENEGKACWESKTKAI